MKWLLRLFGAKQEVRPPTPLERLTDEYVFGDAVDGMEPEEFEARAIVIMEGRAAVAEEWTDEPGAVIRVDGDPRWLIENAFEGVSGVAEPYYPPPAADEPYLPLTPEEEREVRLVQLEETYPLLRTPDVAERVVDEARRVDPARWNDPDLIEVVYLSLFERQR